MKRVLQYLFACFMVSGHRLEQTWFVVQCVWTIDYNLLLHLLCVDVLATCICWQLPNASSEKACKLVCVRTETSWSTWQCCAGFTLHTLLLTKNPGLSRTPCKIFQDLFGASECLNIKKKTAFTYNIQSVVHCRKFSMKQNVLHYCWFSIWTTTKMHDFQGYFSRTFQDLKL